MKEETSLQPGVLRLVKLQSKGRLQKGDIVETCRTGQVEVAFIQTAQSICVKNRAGQYFNISGLGLKGRIVPAQSAA